MLLIGLDVGFMVSSVLAIFTSMCVLHARVRSIRKNAKEERRSVRIAPSVALEEKEEKEEKEEAKNLRQIRLQYGAASKEYQQAVKVAQVD